MDHEIWGYPEIGETYHLADGQAYTLIAAQDLKAGHVIVDEDGDGSTDAMTVSDIDNDGCWVWVSTLDTGLGDLPYNPSKAVPILLPVKVVA